MKNVEIWKKLQEYKEITTQKDKLKKQVLDYDSARRRLAQVCHQNLKKTN